VEGKGEPALVFVHCWTCDRHLWDAQVQAFAPRHRVVTLDLGGHGESGRDRKDWSIEAYGADVRAVVEKLDLGRVILIGHSMGGPVILEAARTMGGRVAALIPVDALTNVGEREKPEELEAFLKPFEADYRSTTSKFLREYMFVAGTDAGLIERIVEKSSAAPPEIAVPSLRHAFLYDAAAALRATTVPIRALNADKFPTNLEAARRYAPQFDAVIMKGVGHYPMLEDAARFNHLLREIVDGFAPAGSSKPR
jgi:pimeloyl-ACP methyl ester carboxylesterase